MASFEQRNKLWSVRFRVMTDEGEKNKRLSGFKTKKEANEAYAKFVASYEYRPVSSGTDKPRLFSDLCDRYLENLKTNAKESSFYDIRSRVKIHILPFFGKMKIADITPSLVLEWQRSLAKYSFQYRSTLRNNLSSIFKHGERYFDIINVVKKVEPIRNLEEKKEMQFWTPEEFGRFINEVEDPTLRCFFRFLYVSGCRKSEGLALSPDCINAKNNTVRIRSTLTTKTLGASYTVTAPKTDTSNRTIPLPEKLIKDMLALCQEGDAFVFGKEKPLSTSTIDRRFAEACARASVKRIRIHDLRHSCASLLISEGISIVAVSKRLGHASVTQTLNTYSHMMPEDVSKIIDIFDGI